MYSPDIHSALSSRKGRQSVHDPGGFTPSVYIKTTALEHVLVFTVNTYNIPGVEFCSIGCASYPQSGTVGQ